jgi:rod shape-determining protein MreC
MGITGGVQGIIADVDHYFGLNEQNEMLARRVAELENQMDIYRQAVDTLLSSEQVRMAITEATAQQLQHYRYITARVVANTINRPHNYITLDKGTAQGVEPNMGVITPDGNMVGYVVDCSEHYAVVMPIINIDFRGGGKLDIEGDTENRIGSISWDGRDASRVTMSDLLEYANPKAGDKVSSNSHYFPPMMKVNVGEVESISKSKNKNTYEVVLRLATDFSSLDHLILVHNERFKEVTELENKLKK